MSFFLSWPRLLGGVFLLAAGLLSVLAFQEAPSVYDNTLFTQVAVLETRVVALETRVGQIVPTQEFFASPTPTVTSTATIDPFVRACVRAGINLIVRDSPGGNRAGILTGGTQVRYLPVSAKAALGFTYVRLDTSGLIGTAEEWVAREYLVVCDGS